MGHGQVEDQALSASPILEEASDLHVAVPLACACPYAVLRPNDVSGRAEQQHQLLVKYIFHENIVADLFCLVLFLFSFE